jgi:hypothetical protein
MSTIEKQTLEVQRERWKRAIEAEKLAIAGGDLSLDKFVAGDPDLALSRREHLLELQSRLAEVESRLASEEMSA